MRLTIEENGYGKQAALLRRCVAQRIGQTDSGAQMRLSLRVDGQLGAAESYAVTCADGAWTITGADPLGLCYGIGKFLHTAQWNDRDFTPHPPAGIITPAHSFRAVYASIHFHNWYHQASAEELQAYLEELLLWGYNTVVTIIPVVCLHSFEEPMFYELIDKSRSLCRLAREFGMQVGLIVNPNQGLLSAPESIGADLSLFEHRGGSSGMNICPHKEGAMEYLTSLWIAQLEQFKDIGLDYVISWPYDEGGCGCEQCRPWGSNGFCDLSTAFFKEVERLYPAAKKILSAWYFDHPVNEGEYEGLWRRLQGDMAYVDYLMVDGHGAFPTYPLTHERLKPMLNFPEISMWGLAPWGGRGANPLPRRFQRLWDSSKDALSGGMPYSEGIYEDISKVQLVAYYWEPDRSYRDALAEYINYEYSGDVIDEVLEIMELIEVNHVGVYEKRQPDMAACIRAEELARSVDRRLGERARGAWRWRLLYIRAVMDRVVYQYHTDHDNGRSVRGMEQEKTVKHYGQNVVLRGDEVTLYTLRKTKEWYLEESEEAMAMAEELCALYHTDRENTHMATYPPVQGREAALAGKVFGTT
ncbi:MAG: hypothetical protein IJT78_01095 [Oscillospiraceae bacterium]|nr:hypothetical protein [Oscillospiraceae bacterium]